MCGGTGSGSVGAAILCRGSLGVGGPKCTFLRCSPPDRPGCSQGLLGRRAAPSSRRWRICWCSAMPAKCSGTTRRPCTTSRAGTSSLGWETPTFSSIAIWLRVEPSHDFTTKRSTLLWRRFLLRVRISRKKRENFQRLVLSDRYDGRGHLHDLSEYDAEHNSWNRNYNLSEEEARIEALCDEERYLAMHTDLLEEEARQEEEYKRLSEALAEDGTYNSVGFKYHSDYYDPSQPTEEEDSQKDDKDSSDLEDNEEPFIAPEGMNVPSDVELPATAKMHAIIERTANFVCKQGAQFEIMLKAKQARNSQFDFLRFDHYLNPYYKHILRAMKEGRYTMLAEKQNEQQKKILASTEKHEEEDDDDDDDDEGSDYLHPSLFASKRCSRLEELTRPLKVMDPDHPLAALVRKAKNEKMASQLAANVAPAPAPDTQTESTTEETTVTSTFYNYYMLPDGTYCLVPPPPAVDASACYSSITAEENTKESAIPSPQSTILPSLNSGDSSNRLTAGLGATSTLAPVVAIIPPPPDIQPVIDKLAQYVARNGIKFETSVRAKNDSRFEFLQPWHQYNPYYEFKKHFFMQKEGILSQPYITPDENSISTESLNDPVMHSNTVDDGSIAEGAPSANVDASSSSKPVCDGKLKVSFAPISFAIKMKETDLLPLEKNRVKLYDDSEEEEDGDGKDGRQNKTSSSSNSQTLNTATIAEEKKPQLTPEELEAKQAKQKLEDRLAAAAREKLAQAAKESKEKQLQAERKRKAALFLQTLKNPLEMESGRPEENSYSQEVGNMNYDLLPEDTIVPTTEYPITARSPIREYSRVEREKKKKKRKKRSRSRSHSPKIHYNSKSRSHSKVKHSLPTAYRTVRRSRSRSRSPRKVSQPSERRREDDRAVPCSYRGGYTPGNSKKRSRSRSPYENRKKRHPRSESKSKVRSCSRSPSRQGAHSSTHSTSISPVESRGSSQERYRGNSQDKEGHIASEIVSSVQTKITQDLMAKVRAMLAASKKMHSSAS